MDTCYINTRSPERGDCMGLVTLADFESVLRQSTEMELNYSLVGGLAVSLWTQHYQIKSVHLPLYSKDLDVRGDKPAYLLLGQYIKQEGHSLAGFWTVKRKDPPGMGRAFVIQVDMAEIGRVNIEVLERLPLLDEPDGPPRGLTVEIAGIRVLDPLSLLICKAHALHHRRPDAPSNDRVHIELLSEIAPKFAAEAKERGLELSERITALRAAHALFPLPLDEAFWLALG